MEAPTWPVRWVLIDIYSLNPYETDTLFEEWIELVTGLSTWLAKMPGPWALSVPPHR